MNITIDPQKCIKCLKCTKICTTYIFNFNAQSKEIELHNPAGCISCGHCVDVCPDGAISHKEFPAEKTHRIDYTEYPKPDELLTLIRARRSNRAFSNVEIPEQELLKIVDAAHLAPTAMNLQELSFTVVTAPEKLKTVSNFVMDYYLGLYKKATFPLLKPFTRGLLKKYGGAFAKMLKAKNEGKDPILRGGVALILISAPKGAKFGVEDANMAYQNGSLMAETLGISQFYTGFVLNTVRSNKGKLEQMLGIDGQIVAGMALGYPEFRYHSYSERKPLKLNILK